MNEHGVFLTFGKHEGELIGRVPMGYLKWMVREKTPQFEQARHELQRRGTATPDLEVSGHALDRFSQRFLRVWTNERKPEESGPGYEGLWTFVHRMAREAFDQGPQGTDQEKIMLYKGIKWVFATESTWPVLKSVM